MNVVKHVDGFFTRILGPTGWEVEFSANDKIVIGVSGGCDSLTLLHILVQHDIHPRQHIIVAHLDHQIREESAQDAEFVRQTAVDWDVAVRIETIDVPKLARENGHSLEEAGRGARYRFLTQVAAEFGARFVITAHHEDDQVETVLMHFLRGAGLAGMRGILPVAPMPQDPRFWLLRPLIGVNRQQLEAYAQEAELRPRYDASNEELIFFRNQLRHEVLPFLSMYNPQIKNRLVNTATVVAADYAFLDSLATEAWDGIVRRASETTIWLDKDGWRALPLSLRRYTLRMGLMNLRGTLRDIAFRALEQARYVAEEGDVGSQASLPTEVNLVVDYDVLRLEVGTPVPHLDLPQVLTDTAQALTVPGEIHLAGCWQIEARRLSGVSWEQIRNNQDPWIAFVPVGLADQLVVRSRRRGERLQPLGLEGHTTKISDIMINRQIPARFRSQWPIVATADRPVWVVGHDLDDRARVEERDDEVIEISCWAADE